MKLLSKGTDEPLRAGTGRTGSVRKKEDVTSGLAVGSNIAGVRQKVPAEGAGAVRMPSFCRRTGVAALH